MRRVIDSCSCQWQEQHGTNMLASMKALIANTYYNLAYTGIVAGVMSVTCREM